MTRYSGLLKKVHQLTAQIDKQESPPVAHTSALPWWHNEAAIEIGDIPHHVAKRTDGEMVSVASAWRWCKLGLYGVRLRRFKSGGRWATTVEELRRFEVAVTAKAEAMDEAQP